ncbi:hypothetical protein [Solibacillus sp. R5-41]|nr:hypothetical protein [Solibacillus sp. R5-41]
MKRMAGAFKEKHLEQQKKTKENVKRFCGCGCRKYFAPCAQSICCNS